MLRVHEQYKKETIKINGKKLSYTNINMPQHKDNKNVPSQYGSKMGSNPKPKNKPRALTKAEEDLFKKHEKLHSKKHIAFMKAFLRAGKGCFLDGHREALKAVGK